MQVGVYIPKDDANGEQLTLNMSMIRWGTADEKVPMDLIGTYR